MALTDAGLVLGDDSILVRMSNGGDGPPSLALETDRDRFAALASVVGGRPVGNEALHHVEAAARFWQRGDKALANLRLIFADLPRLALLSDAYRLTLAAHLLDEGMTPSALMKALGIELATEALKYAPDQARIPAGHGAQSGQFTFSRESAVAPAARIVLASEDDSPSENKSFLQREGESVPTPEKDPKSHHPANLLPGPTPVPVLPPGIGIGPFASKSIPAGPTPRPNALQQKKLNEIGICHGCGTTDPGTDSGNWVDDHQESTTLITSGTPQRYYSQCIR